METLHHSAQEVKAPEWVPDWVIQKVKDLDANGELLHDEVYNIYECGCFLLHDLDIGRRGRLVQTKINGKRVNKIVCYCNKKSRFVTKVKICSGCDTIMLHVRQKKGPCGDCCISAKKKTTVFFQNENLFEEIPKYPTYTNCNCKYRGECLSKLMYISEKEFIVHLWCYNCPKAEEVIDI